ncbi:hypothetical protein [Geodermatophilus sp. SYSU D01105]
MADDDRSAAFLVRVWFEGESEQFRARVTAVGSDSTEGVRTVAVASSPSQVIDAVSHWLEEFLRYGTATD